MDILNALRLLDLRSMLIQQPCLGIVFITHDLGVVANIADRVAVLYAGQVIELGSVEESGGPEFGTNPSDSAPWPG